MENQRLTKGIWIPIEIWKDKNLTWNEKILFLEIDSFTTNDKDCYFSNEYIAELLGVSETNANKILSSLIRKGYVIKTGFDGRHRYVKTALSYTTTQTCNNDKAGTSHPTGQGCQERQGCIVTDDRYNKINNNKDNKYNERELKEKFAEFVKLYKKLTGKAVRGVNTEFESFSKHHKDWKDVVPLLIPAIEKETEARNEAKAKGEFFPMPKMLQTYLGKQRAWELYAIGISRDEDVEKQKKVSDEHLLQEFFSTISLEKEAEILGYNVEAYIAFSDEKRQNWRTAYRDNFLDWIKQNKNNE